MSKSAADRNLLFGILALQMDFVSRDALIAAMHAWVLDKAKPLAQIFRDQQALAADAHDLLDALVRKHLQLHDDDPAKSLAALSSLGSARKDLERVADADVQASLYQVAAARPADDPYSTKAPTVGAPTSASMRFRILRPHAKGGLGQVSVALDEELRREVALKEIQERHADHPESRDRFVMEAEITGGLEHPGIVPVYGLGHSIDGRPYYAMRFIRGSSLEEAIVRFHQAEGPKRDPAERALALRQLLRRFIDVCNAIAYAHSRGVLHRDLKPGNIMLGRYGETLVVDWGLAKPLMQVDASLASEEPPLQPSMASGSAATLAGSTVGTPQFMSPEQAAGRLDRLGPASDIYCLGATLYALLTGQPPVTGADLGEILRKVQQGEIVPPRQVKRNVPPALEAICQKAMALKPEDRYAAASDLAEDIEHWLADEAVSAYREPWRERAGRWMRRHRTKVTAGVAALLVAVVSLTVAMVLLTAANERERSAKELAEANEKKARERFRQAREVVDNFYTAVSDSTEMRAKGAETLRTKLLKSATAYYENFVQENEGDNPQLKPERGRTFRRLADLYLETGQHHQADQAYQQALAISKQVAAEHPNVPEYQTDIARSHLGLANLYIDTGRAAQAEKAYKAALTIFQQLADDHPTVAKYQTDLAGSYLNLANLYITTGRAAQAEKAYEAGLAIWKQLAANHPHVPNYRSNLGEAQMSLANVYSITGRVEQAEKAYERALTIFQQLAADHPTDPEYQHELASSHYNLAVLYRATARAAQAEKAYIAGQAIQKQLAAEHPTVPNYRLELAKSYINLANFYRAAGRAEQAETAYDAALAISRQLAADHPTIPEYQNHLAVSHNNLALLYRATGRAVQAEKASKAALTIWQQLAADHPTEGRYQNSLASCHLTLANLYDTPGRSEEALKECDEAIRLSEVLLKQEPRSSTAREVIWKAHWVRAITLGKLDRHAEAVQSWDRAIAFAPEPNQAFVRVDRAVALARSGDHARAVAEIEELSKATAPGGEALYHLSCAASLASVAVRKDVRLPAADQAKLAEQYAVRAIELLRQARDAGYFKDAAKVAHMKNDSDLAPLRSRPDYQKLFAELEAAAR